MGKEKFIESVYSDTIISFEKFNELKEKGLAITPKVVKDFADSNLDVILTSVVY